MLAIKIRAKNDTDGNPRRGWLLVNTAGDVVNFVDEGYRGKAQLSLVAHRMRVSVVEGPEIQVGPGEYRAWKGLRYETA
jgi:hypothetical protein